MTTGHYRNLGTLPIPLSQEENDQIAQLMDGKNIWLGIQPRKSDRIYYRVSENEDLISYTYPDHWSVGHEAWGVASYMDGEMDFTNWRSDDMGKPDLSSGTQKMGAIISGTDKKWETRDENEKHYAMCIFRF